MICQVGCPNILDCHLSLSAPATAALDVSCGQHWTLQHWISAVVSTGHCRVSLPVTSTSTQHTTISNVPPLSLADIERVNSVKLLAVFISDTLNFDEHVKYVLTVCGQRCYLLKTLRWQGLSRRHINTVFQSLIISRLSYALPAWGGFLSKEQINKIDAFLARAHRFGYTLETLNLNNIQHDLIQFFLSV